MMQKKTSSLLLKIIIFCLSVNPLFAQEITTEDEIKVIQNKKSVWGNNPQIKLELTGTLGDLDNTNDNYMFYLPEGIAGDPEGNLYVLDTGNFRVQKFDKNLKYLKTFGRQGQGPGEFVNPRSVDFSDNKLYVNDWRNRRIEIFDPEGKNTGMVNLNRSNRMDYYIRIRAFGPGEIVGRNPDTENINRYHARSKNNPVLSLIHVMDKNAKIIRKFGEGVIYSTDDWRTGMNRMVFSTDENNNVYTAYSFRNIVEKFSSDGKQIFRTKRPADKKKKITIDELGAEHMVLDIDVDSKGRIYVLGKNRRMRKDETIDKMMTISHSGVSTQFRESSSTLTETDMYELVVFDSEGIYLGELPLTHFCDGIRIIGDKLYTVDTDRTMGFFIYKIVGE